MRNFSGLKTTLLNRTIETLEAEKNWESCGLVGQLLNSKIPNIRYCSSEKGGNESCSPKDFSNTDSNNILKAVFGRISGYGTPRVNFDPKLKVC